MEGSRSTLLFLVFISFGSWGNYVNSVCFCCCSGTSSSSTEGRETQEADPGASAGAEPAASEGPGDGGESEAPEGEGPAEPGMDSWSIALFRFLLSFWLIGHPLVTESLYNYLFDANAERSSSRVPVEAPLRLGSLERAPPSEDAERVFLARWTTWRDSRVAVSARIGE